MGTMVVNFWLSARLATSFILPRHFLEFGTASLSRKTLRAGGRSQDLVYNQNLVCAPPGSQSPAGLPAAAYFGAASPSRKTLRAGGQRLGSGSKCAATAKASLTYIPELYRLIRSLPLI